MGDESGSLNLAVQFVAVVEGFSTSLDKLTAKLESMTTRIDKMSGKSSKVSDSMAKDQDKVSASMDKSSKKMSEAATAANNYGRTLETSREALKGLDAATIANLNSSNMSKEMFGTLSSKMKVFSGASWESKEALVSMAKSADNNVMAFKQMSGALEANEKHLWSSLTGVKQLRAEYGVDKFPKDIDNTVKSVDRLKFAQATLNGEIYKSGGVLFNGKQNFVDFQKSIMGLTTTYGENAMLATNMSNRLGSYVKTVAAAKTELTAYTNVAEKDLSLANAIVSQRIKLEEKNYAVASSTGKMKDQFDQLRDSVNGNKNDFDRISGAAQRLNADFIKLDKGTKAFNAEVAKLGIMSPQTIAHVDGIRGAIDRGNLTHAEGIKKVREHNSELTKLGKSANVTSGFWNNLNSKLVGGGAAAKGATDYFSRLGQAVGSLSAWMIAAAVIGTVTAAIASSIKAVVDYDQALKSLQAISGGTEAEIHSLGKEILDISDTTKYSAAEIAKGAIFIAQAGFTAGESLQVIGAAAKGAQGTLESLTIASDLLTTVLRAFHIDAFKASLVMDMLSVAANKSKTDLEGMRIVFNYLGPAAYSAGISLEETLGTIMALSNVGMRMSTVGTSLRQMFISLENPNAKLRKALVDAGMAADSLSVKTQGGLIPVLQNLDKVIGGSLTKSVQFFNVRTGNTALVLSQMSEHVALMVKFTKEYGVSAAMAGTQSEGLAVKISMLSNQFQNFIIRMSEGGLTKAFKAVIDILGVLIKTIEYLVNNPLVNFIATTGVMYGAFLLLRSGILLVANALSVMFVGASLEAAITAVRTMGLLVALRDIFSTLFVVIGRLGNGIKLFGVYLLSMGASTISVTAAAASFKEAWIALNVAFSASTIGFCIAVLAALAATIYKVVTSAEKQSQALQEQTILYANNEKMATDFAIKLRKLNEVEEKSVEDSNTYVALLKQIRETFPEVTAEIVKNKNSLELQAVALDKVAAGYKKQNEVAAKAALEDIGRQYRIAGYEAAFFSQAVTENRSQMSRWLSAGVDLVSFLMGNLDAALTGSEKATKVATEAWVSLQLAWNTTSAQAVIEAASKSEAALNKQRDLYSQVTSIIINSSKDVREALLAMIPAGEMKKISEGAVKAHELFMNSLDVDMDPIIERQTRAVSEMGSAWRDYYLNQDERGRAEVASMAINAKKKIDIAMKAFEKENSDADLRLNERIRLYDEAEKTMLKSRAKHVEDLLKLMDKFYEEQDKKIKEGISKQLESLDITKQKEIIALGERYTLESEFVARRAALEAKDVEDRKRVIDKGMKDELEAAQKNFEAKKEILKSQTQIFGADLLNKELEIKQALATKELAIYKDVLSNYKTMMGERSSLVNKYKEDHLAALKAIEKAENDLKKVLEDINLKKRETLRMTMTEEQTAADKEMYLSELLAKGRQALYDADKAGSEEVKKAKLAAAKEYFDKYTGLIDGITIKNKTADGTYIEDTKKTQEARLRLFEKAEQAYKDHASSVIATEKSIDEAAKKGYEAAKASFASLVADYEILKKAFETKLILSLETEAALGKMKKAAEEINKTAVEVVVKFYGEASPKEKLDIVIESIKKRLTDFSGALKLIDLGFVISFKGTLGEKTEGLSLDVIITSILSKLSGLKTEVEKIIPSLLINFYGNVGTETKPLLSYAFLQAKEYARVFAEEISKMVNRFFVYFLGDDNGTHSPLSAVITAVENKMRQLSNSINSMRTVFTITTRHVTEGSPSGGSRSSSSSSSSSSSGDRYPDWYRPYTPDSTDYRDSAEGGVVPGEGDSDSVPTMLTPGEFVVRKSAVNVFGEGFFHMINRMKSFSMPKFNMGGMVQAFAQGGGVQKVNEPEVFTLNLQAGSAKMPLKVIGNPKNMRQTIRAFEKELSKMRLSNA